MVSSPHPDANQLSAFLEGSLPDPARRALIVHLSVCTACRQWAGSAQTAVAEAAGPRPPRLIPLDAPSRAWRLIPAGLAAATILAAAGLWMRRSVPVPTPPPPTVVAPVAAAVLPAPPKPHRRAPSPASAAPVAEVAAAPNWYLLPVLPVANGVAFQSTANFSPLMTGFLDQTQMVQPQPGSTLAASANLVAWTTPQTTEADLVTTPTAPVATSPNLAPSLAAQITPEAFASAFASPSSTSAPFTPNSAVALDWTVSHGGQLLHSLGSGMWEAVSALPGVHFHSVFSSGSDIWAGAQANQLFVSRDRGAHWRHVPLPAQAGQTPITGIVFSDANSGQVSLANGQRWLTTTAGASWSSAF